MNKTKTIETPPLLQSQTDIDLPKHTVISQPISNCDYYDNMNIFTEFGDLSPSNMLSLFDTFIGWPEYKESPFLTSMEANMVKMETSMETVDGLAIPEEDDHHLEVDMAKVKKK